MKPIALHRIDIASPCTASWDAMQGDDRVRHCKDCNKNVFNLSAMPSAEGAALLAANVEGNLCVRFYRRADGTVMTSDCGGGKRTARSKAWRVLPGLAGTALLAMAAGVHAGDPATAPTVTMGAPPAPAYVMGDPAPPPQASPAAPVTPPVELTGKPMVTSFTPTPAKKETPRKDGSRR